ncbi:MAG: hypothetical protein HFJ30_07165 [Clostridia bacterium]|jgi:hypothetical protein|nr:hypothetical protein [Clostridia bacterium]
MLKSPSTVRFAPYSQWNFSKKDGCISVKSYVDSQNSFGATIRTQFEMKTKNNTIISLKLDGKEYIK